MNAESKCLFNSLKKMTPNCGRNDQVLIMNYLQFNMYYKVTFIKFSSKYGLNFEL